MKAFQQLINCPALIAEAEARKERRDAENEQLILNKMRSMKYMFRMKSDEELRELVCSKFSRLRD